MRSLAIDENNDLVLGVTGNVQMLEGVTAIAQNTRTAVGARRGEMQFAVDSGMPLQMTAFDRFNAIQFEVAARAVILQVEGVQVVNELTVVNDGGTVKYSANITTTEGVINV